MKPNTDITATSRKVAASIGGGLLVGLLAASSAQAGYSHLSAQTLSHCGYLPSRKAIYSDTSTNVEIIQRKLNVLGYNAGPVDGKFGKKSKRAVREFQADHDLSADGVVGGQTTQKLAYAAHASANVRRCQKIYVPSPRHEPRAGSTYYHKPISLTPPASMRATSKGRHWPSENPR